jgi:hypothetical protein
MRYPPALMPEPTDVLEWVDAGCDWPGELREVVPDDEVAGLVLFADIDFLDPAAVERRRLEWAGLFADEAPAL